MRRVENSASISYSLLNIILQVEEESEELG